MKLSIGIVGLPNVGKSTLFNIITNQTIDAQNYPFCTIDPNVGVVPVPDSRLDTLTQLSHSKSTIPAVVEFFDIAGLVKGANSGEGLGNKFLSHIRDVQAIVQVLRVFHSDDIIHVEETIDPVRDLEIINTELIFKDLATVEKRLEKAEVEAKTGDKEKAKLVETLTQVKASLDRGDFTQEFAHEPITHEMQLLTSKKQIYLLNGSEGDVTDVLKEKINELGAEYVVVDLINASEIPQLITASYRILDLISFFTTGEDESRAWTCSRGTKAPQAAGVIHTDFEKKFIRSEVIHYDKLVEVGSWQTAKQKGWIRLEGKEYEMKDGDVIVVRHG